MTEQQRFEDHLKLTQNHNIIFSGKFGIGKTYFLNDFFKNNTDYEYIRIAPVNYSIAQNEDIFKYINFDVIFELLEKGIDFEKIDFDPERISLEKIYDIFWRNIDPYDEGGQFCDRGRHYRAAVFLANDKQKKAFELSKKKVLKKLGSSKTLSVLELENINFFEAEDYHQDYYQKKPIRYKFYRYNCGRDDRLESVWGD
jgi:hypothetical protein